MFGVGSIPWSPLARGFLTRPLSVSTKRSESDVYVSEQSYFRFIHNEPHFVRWFNLYKSSPGGEGVVNRSVFSITDLLVLFELFICSVEELSKKKGVSMAQIATAWVLAKDGMSFISIPQAVALAEFAVRRGDRSDCRDHQLEELGGSHRCVILMHLTWVV